MATSEWKGEPGGCNACYWWLKEHDSYTPCGNKSGEEDGCMYGSAWEKAGKLMYQGAMKSVYHQDYTPPPKPVVDMATLGLQKGQALVTDPMLATSKKWAAFKEGKGCAACYAAEMWYQKHDPPAHANPCTDKYGKPTASPTIVNMGCGHFPFWGTGKYTGGKKPVMGPEGGKEKKLSNLTASEATAVSYTTQGQAPVPAVDLTTDGWTVNEVTGCWCCRWAALEDGGSEPCHEFDPWYGGPNADCGYAEAWEDAGGPTPEQYLATAIAAQAAWPGYVPTSCPKCEHKFTCWSDNSNDFKVSGWAGGVVPGGGAGPKWFCTNCLGHFLAESGEATGSGGTSKDSLAPQTAGLPTNIPHHCYKAQHEITTWSDDVLDAGSSLYDLTVYKSYKGAWQCTQCAGEGKPNGGAFVPTGHTGGKMSTGSGGTSAPKQVIGTYDTMQGKVSIVEVLSDPWPNGMQWTSKNGCLACAWAYWRAKKAHAPTVPPCAFGKGNKTSAHMKCYKFNAYKFSNKVGKKNAGYSYQTNKVVLAAGGGGTAPASRRKKWPFALPAVGCMACAYGYLVLGKGQKSVCSSNLGPSGASDGCEFYDAYMAKLAETPDYNTPEKFCCEMVLPKFVPAEKVQTRLGHTETGSPYGYNETSVGEKAGLIRGLELSMLCAEYYVLERLVNNSFERETYGDYDDSGRMVGVRSRLTPYPVNFGQDLRGEMRAYTAKKAYEATTRLLAEQLSTYLILACGGELRHRATSIAEKGPKHVWKACLHKHSPVCGGPCKKLVDLPKHKCTPKCGTVCGHECTEESLCTITNEKLYEYASTAGNGERAAGWAKWHKLVKQDPPAWMRACYAGFRIVSWGGGGYGGKPWAQGARVCYDYLAGNITAELFIDRCWTLHHHGGNIFNKFWHINTLTTRNGGYISNPQGKYWVRLDYVLAVQASGDYDMLAEFCGDTVRFMWKEQEADKVRHAGQSHAAERFEQRTLARTGD